MPPHPLPPRPCMARNHRPACVAPVFPCMLKINTKVLRDRVSAQQTVRPPLPFLLQGRRSVGRQRDKLRRPSGVRTNFRQIPIPVSTPLSSEKCLLALKGRTQWLVTLVCCLMFLQVCWENYNKCWDFFSQFLPIIRDNEGSASGL